VSASSKQKHKKQVPGTSIELAQRQAPRDCKSLLMSFLNSSKLFNYSQYNHFHFSRFWITFLTQILTQH
jgi:hypothetical protein